MDNNELDKILKEKLKSQITPPKELEQKMQNVIKEQKAKKQNNKISKYRTMKMIISMAAVVLIAFIIGISFNNNLVDFEEKTITIATITEIKPTKTKNEILEFDSEFLIYAEGENITVESVQKALYIEPALEYSIEKTRNNNEYKLTFNQNIPNNTIVKLQYVKDLITQDSWAYQTSDDLSVNGTYPSNGTNYVSKNSVIEIEFSYATVGNLEENIEITPAINGTWEHLGKIWRFTPHSELKDGKYCVKVKNGIIAEQKTMKNEYLFEFVVGEQLPECTYNSISLDGINTFKPDEAVRIYYQTSYNYKLNISKIEIAKFENKDEFIKYVQNGNYKNTTNMGEFKFEQTQNYVQLTNGLQVGYYVAAVYGENNAEVFNCPVQINELSAYAIETERDVLVWVANGENLAQGVQVQYQGKIEKTNNQGLAEFKDIADDSETVKYLEIGNTSNKLIVGIYNYDIDNYHSGYLYTDRPLYKSTDKINIWGYVPRQLFYDNVEDEFYIELNSEGKQKVKVQEDGNLNYSIDLKNHMDDKNAIIKLYYKENCIAVRSISIENYEAQNYTYDISYEKNYALEGNKFEFDVKVNHITGLPVPNKTVRADFNGKTYRVTSEDDGIAHFSIDIPKEETISSYPASRGITVFNGDVEEYTGKETYINVYVLTTDVYMKKEGDETYKASLYKLATDINTNVDYSLEALYNGAYDTDVTVKLQETTYTRYVSGYTYNEYTKENEPQYLYSDSKNEQILKTVKTQNGIIEINKNELEIKQDTEEKNYAYTLIYEYKDQSGREVREYQGVYYDDSNATKEIGYYYEEWRSSDLLWKARNNKINTSIYYTYRYLLKANEEKQFSIGDTIEFKLEESTTTGEKEITNDGKILRLILKEDIIEKEIIENNNFNYTFDKTDFPGCKITSAYFYKGKFYRMPIYYFDFNEEDRKVDVEITADKEKYHPGDEVTLTVKTTNNGKPVKSFVNVSVVNEAVFQVTEDITSILEEVYANKSYPVYTYSTFKDDIMNSSGRRRRRRWRKPQRLWRYSML